MVIDELGATELEYGAEIKSSLIIFVAFVMGACFPTLPYVIMINSDLDSQVMFIIATCITVGGLFLAGALKRFVTGVNWIRSGLEMLVVGFFAFTVAYVIGLFIPF